MKKIAIAVLPDPVIRNGRYIRANVTFWQTTFWEVWEPLPIDAKLSWLVFVSQTLCVISLIELFLLRK